MSLLVITAKDGGQYQIDPRTIANLKELGKWIQQQAGVPVAHQILLSGRATQLREATLPQETEIFVFDKALLEPNVEPPLIPIPQIPTAPPTPSDTPAPKDITGWVNLYQKRLQWAESIIAKGKSLVVAIANAEAHIKNIQRSVSVAAENLETHVSMFQKKLHDREEVAGNTLRKQEGVFSNWEASVMLASQIPLHPGFASVATPRPSSNSRGPMLSDVMNIGELKKAAASAELKAQNFIQDMEKVSGKVKEAAEMTALLREQIQQTSVGSSGNYQNDEPQNLLQDMENVARKMALDCERVQDAQSTVQVAKWAVAHVRDYMPGLNDSLRDMGRLYHQALSMKNQVIHATHKNLTGVVAVQSLLGQIQPHWDKTILRESDSFIYLSRAHQLPYVYGALLVECVRRKEWAEKLTEESKSLAEDLANLKNEEEKRRKKWQKHVGIMLPFSMGPESRIIELDINLEGGDDRWPHVTRQDVEVFLEHCKTIPGMAGTVKEVAQLYNDLDKPLRKQSRRVSGFKHGSVHEAAMGASSFFSNEKAKLEEKIAFLESQDLSQKSRIRKLEDLLHKSFGRNAGTPIIPPPSPIPGQCPPSNVMGSSPSMNGYIHTSGPTPITSRRLSGNVEQSEKEKLLATRIFALEAELVQEKESIATLQKDIAEREHREKEKDERIVEGEHTKNDLLANLEAIQQEFLLERKELHSQIDELRGKVDEMYEELDRAEEKRIEETDKGTALQSKLDAMEDELLKAIEEKEEWQKKYSEEVEKLKKERDDGTEHVKRDFEEERSRNAVLEAMVGDLKVEIAKQTATLSQLENALNEMQSNLDSAKQQHANVIQNQTTALIKLQQAHRTLAPREDVPKELSLLADTIEVLVMKKVSENKRKFDELQETYNKLKASMDVLQTRFDQRTIRAKDLTQRLFTHNTRSIQLLESLGFSVTYRDNTMVIQRISRSNSDSMTLSRSQMPSSGTTTTTDGTTTSAIPKNPATGTYTPEDINLLYWMDASGSDSESEKYAQYINSITMLDLDAFSDAIVKRVKEAEHMARRWQKEAKAYREKSHRYHAEANEKIAFKSFKEGDIALFLPTRNQATRPWAAFNVGAPHYFLKEHDSHKLRNRDWLLARIHKIEERVVDLSRSTSSLHANASAASDTASVDDENPFELSDGLRWYLLEAYEEKPGAPSTPGLSSSTVFSSKVDAKGSLKSRKPVTGAKKTLSHLQEGEHRRKGSNSSINRTSIFGLVGGGPNQSNNANGDRLIPTECNPDSAVATAGGSRASTPALVSRPQTAMTAEDPMTATSQPATNTATASSSMPSSKQPITTTPTGAAEKLADLQSVLSSRML